MGGEGKTLRLIAEAFKGLSTMIEPQNLDLDVVAFSRACSLVSALFVLLGFTFKFVEMDYVAKVDDLQKASKSIETLKSMLDQDVEQNTVTKPGSHSRNLLRVKRGLDMVRVLFEQILVTDWLRVDDGVPCSSQSLLNLQSDDTKAHRKEKTKPAGLIDSARIQMQCYVTSSAAVINYVDRLFLSREIGIDW